jgi:Ca2+-binding EF-hand superfamily protein
MSLNSLTSPASLSKGKESIKPAVVRTISSLVDEEGDLTEEAVSVLDEIFHKYDLDKDAHLNKEELLAFSSDTNADGSPFSEEELEEIVEYLDVRDNDNALTLKGFVEMYGLQTSADEELTWADLYVHGYTREGGGYEKGKD